MTSTSTPSFIILLGVFLVIALVAIREHSLKLIEIEDQLKKVQVLCADRDPS